MTGVAPVDGGPMGSELGRVVGEVRAALMAVADPKRGDEMAAYMKGVAPFLGVAAGPRRAAVRDVVASVPIGTEYDVARALFFEPEREFAYVGIDLLRARNARLSADPDALLALALHNPWWDCVDGMSAVIGQVAGRTGRDREVAAWARTSRAVPHWMWQRRVGIIFQLGRRDNLDLGLLEDSCSANLGETDFFLRKAVGWALRDAARRRPDEVRRYVEAHRSQMSGLTLREATKHL